MATPRDWYAKLAKPYTRRCSTADCVLLAHFRCECGEVVCHMCVWKHREAHVAAKRTPLSPDALERILRRRSPQIGKAKPPKGPRLKANSAAATPKRAGGGEIAHKQRSKVPKKSRRRFKVVGKWYSLPAIEAESLPDVRSEADPDVGETYALRKRGAAINKQGPRHVDTPKVSQETRQRLQRLSREFGDE